MVGRHRRFSMRLVHVGRRCLSFVAVLATGVALTNPALAATRLLDVNGVTTGSGVVNGGVYSWEDPIWTTDGTGVTGTTNWVDGDFAKFAAGTDAGVTGYSLTVGADHVIAGMQLSTTVAGGTTVNLNAAGGSLKIASGAQG